MATASSLDYSQAILHLQQAQNVLILPSSPPDGDSLGSALALYIVLQKLGKKATVVCSHPVPDAYKFLPDSQSIESNYEFSSDFIVTVDVSESGFKDLQYEVKDHKVNIIITPEQGEIHPDKLVIDQHGSKFDLIITVDTAEFSQLGNVYTANQDLFNKVPILNVDHHPSNKMFGTVNLVSEDIASTTMILTELIKSIDPTLIDADTATLLLAGIITDTGSFQNANTSPDAFDVAAALIGYGARQQEIIRHIYKTKELHVLRLWGRILSHIQTDYPHKLVWSQVSQQDFSETGSKESDIGDIIDELLSNAPEAEIVLLFKELPDQTTQVSIRTTTDEISASDLAGKFGGGGHVRAAGAKIKEGDFLDNIHSVLDAAKTLQAGRLGLSQPTPIVNNETVEPTPEISAPTPAEFEPHQDLMSEPMPIEEPTAIEPIIAVQPDPVMPAPTMTEFAPNQPLETPAQPLFNHPPVTTQEPFSAQEEPVYQEPTQSNVMPDPAVMNEPLQQPAPQQYVTDFSNIAPLPQQPADENDPFFHLGNSTGIDENPTQQNTDQDVQSGVNDFSDTSDLDDYLGQAINGGHQG